jgi:Do/DeqQ family serine protease
MWRRTWLTFSQAVTVALALLFVVLTLKPEWLPRPGVGGVLPAPTVVQMVGAPGAAGSAAAGAGPGLRAAAQRALPAVASVTALRAPPQGVQEDPRLRFFHGGPRQAQLGLGSAVIVAPEGYLLTNHHVIEDASDIEVQLADGRSARARVVGSDPETDLALLKIDLERLPVIALGDMAGVQVGDPVLAIGNPFNVGQTVTSGIVSALDRSRVGDSPFQNFIQTDAAINPGNSGGALVDANGALVGINTAIFSRDGGSLGIGFAVPVDTARQVMEALLRDGQVRRGWIGVEPRDLGTELAESLRLPVSEGVLITGVLGNGPAAQGGLRPGDVVLAIGERAVRQTGDLFAAVAALPPGQPAALTVQRGDQRLTLQVRVGERPRAQRVAR